MKNESRLTAWLVLTAKICLVLALLIWLTQQWGHYYIDALLPLYRVILNFTSRNYEVINLNLANQNGEPIIAAHFITINAQTIDGHVLPAGITLDASTLAGHALKHLIIIVGAILVWPKLTLPERGVRLLLSVPFILLLESVDIPLAIAGAVQDVVFFNLSSTYATNKPLLVTWLHVLDGGGRLALSLLAALAVCLIQKPITLASENRLLNNHVELQ